MEPSVHNGFGSLFGSVKVTFHHTGAFNDQFPYLACLHAFIGIVHDPCLKTRYGKTDRSRLGLLAKGIFNTNRRTLGKAITFIDPGLKSFFESAEDLDWKGCPTRNTELQ